MGPVVDLSDPRPQRLASPGSRHQTSTGPVWPYRTTSPASAACTPHNPDAVSTSQHADQELHNRPFSVGSSRRLEPREVADAGFAHPQADWDHSYLRRPLTAQMLGEPDQSDALIQQLDELIDRNVASRCLFGNDLSHDGLIEIEQVGQEIVGLLSFNSMDP